MEGGAMNTCLHVLKETKMDSELLTCLLKFIEYFPDYLSALSRTLLRFFWTTFVETAVYSITDFMRIDFTTLKRHVQEKNTLSAQVQTLALTCTATSENIPFQSHLQASCSLQLK